MTKNCYNGNEKKVCHNCGCEFSDDSDFDICPECRNAAANFFRNFIGRFFTREEVNYLNHLFDGRDLGEGAVWKLNEL